MQSVGRNCLFVVSIFLAMAGCATTDSGNTSGQGNSEGEKALAHYRAMQREGAKKRFVPNPGEIQIIDLPDQDCHPSLTYVVFRGPNGFGFMEESSTTQLFSWRLQGADVTSAESVPERIQKTNFPPGWMRIELRYTGEKVSQFKNTKEITLSASQPNRISLKDFQEIPPAKMDKPAAKLGG